MTGHTPWRDSVAGRPVTPYERARLARAAEAAKRRAAESDCAADFLWRGGEGHADRCVRPAGLVCSREYDPGPPPDGKMYEGTMLGALWGLNNTHAWQLAGWTLVRGA